jgi:hypothetical protein
VVGSCDSSSAEIYRKYYNEVRTHLLLEKGAISRAVQTVGQPFGRANFWGLHHQYIRASVSDRDNGRICPMLRL